MALVHSPINCLYFVSKASIAMVTKLQSKSMHRPLTVTPESNNSHVTDNTDGSGSFGDKLAAFRQQSLDADTSKLQPKPYNGQQELLREMQRLVRGLLVPYLALMCHGREPASR
ncbi:Uncharacterised protein [Serratia fonticola]|uniref:Uncharacterized protein n=1 Tax=Serratia fonticola TaxID=47917 RepID=A0A4U9URH9_SERFO|nr:Uncharacterised protein [Serratia fonticola]